MALSAFTRLYGSCRIPLPEPPAAPVCERCSRVHVLHHSQWPLALKWWILAEWFRTRFIASGAEQELWETLLADSLNGIRAGSAGVNPNGAHLSMSTPVVELYPLALEKAQQWKAAGSTLSRSTDSSKVA